MSKLDELARERHTKAAKVGTISHHRAQTENEMKEVFTLVLAAQLEDLFGEKLRLAKLEAEEAEKNWAVEQDRAAKAKEGALFPIGTRFVEMRQSYGGGSSKAKPTGHVGIYEMVTSDSVHPQNITSQAELGEHVIRILKKDGTPSSRYVRFVRAFVGQRSIQLPYGWHPEDKVLEMEFQKKAKAETGD